MTTLDVSEWSALNIWREADGDVCVRPGLRSIASTTDTVLGAFSIQLDTTGETFHFAAVSDGSSVFLKIYDESFTLFQNFTWSTVQVDVPSLTYGIVQGQMLICCPTLPTLFCMAGSGVCLATSVDSDNPSTTALTDVPRGIATSICNRIVIADERTIYVSDPIGLDGGDVRTFVGANVNQRPGQIYGLHETVGMLVAVTSVGTFGLDVDAFAVQVVGMNGTGWRLLSHIAAFSHQSSCVWRGRVLAMTRDGYTYADTAASDEVSLADPTMPRARGPQIVMPDFRLCRMYASEDGPVIGCPEMRAFHRSDLEGGVHSWWRDWTSTLGDVRGVMTAKSGDSLLCIGSDVLEVTGDFDGTIAITGAEAHAQPYGTFCGVLKAGAIRNMLPRRIYHAAAVDGAMRVAIAVRGSEHFATAPTDPHALASGVDWGDTSVRWVTTPVVGVRIDFGDITDMVASRDVGIEISTQGCSARVNVRPEIELSESAKTRPNASG